mgnify:CR=1 FL=1
MCEEKYRPCNRVLGLSGIAVAAVELGADDLGERTRQFVHLLLDQIEASFDATQPPIDLTHSPVQTIQSPLDPVEALRYE